MCMFHRLQGRSPVSLTEAQARAFLQVSQTHRPYLPCPFTSGRHPTSHPHVLLDSKAAVVGVVLQEIKCPVLLFMGDKGWPYAPESMAARGACVAQLQVGAHTLTRGPLTSQGGLVYRRFGGMGGSMQCSSPRLRQWPDLACGPSPSLSLSVTSVTGEDGEWQPPPAPGCVVLPRHRARPHLLPHHAAPQPALRPLRTEDHTTTLPRVERAPPIQRPYQRRVHRATCLSQYLFFFTRVRSFWRPLGAAFFSCLYSIERRS